MSIDRERKMWYIYTIEYYSAMKKNGIMPSAAAWMDLEIVILSEVNQTEKEILFLFFGCISRSEIVGCAQSLSHVHLSVTPWTVALQAPLPMGFPRQEHWSGLPFPTPGDLPTQGLSQCLCIGRWIFYHWSQRGSFPPQLTELELSSPSELSSWFPCLVV